MVTPLQSNPKIHVITSNEKIQILGNPVMKVKGRQSGPPRQEKSKFPYPFLFEEKCQNPTLKGGKHDGSL